MQTDDIDWDQEPPTEVVHWYQKPHLVSADAAPAAIALFGAFSLGALAAVGVAALLRAFKDER